MGAPNTRYTFAAAAAAVSVREKHQRCMSPRRCFGAGTDAEGVGSFGEGEGSPNRGEIAAPAGGKPLCSPPVAGILNADRPGLQAEAIRSP